MKQFKTINQNKVDMEIGYKKQALIDIMKSDEELGLYDEPKQETLEEAAIENRIRGINVDTGFKQETGKETADYIDRHIVQAMVEIAKQNLYSEEDIKNAFFEGWIARDGKLPFSKAKNKWFKEFKNK